MKLTESAQRTLERYLRTVRVCLVATPRVDVQEVEEDIRAHVARELGGGTQPVGWARLQVALDRLGSPLQWVPEEELPWRHRCLLYLRMGPESWRLSYLSFAFFLGTLLAALLGLWAVSGVALLCAALAGRAALASWREVGESSGARRWLAGPSLILIAAGVLGALLLMPLAVEWVAAEQVLRLQSIKPRFPEFVVGAAQRILAIGIKPSDITLTCVALLKVSAWTVAPLGAWWWLVGMGVLWKPGPIKVTLFPFARSNLGWLAATLIVSGSILMVTGLAGGLIKHVNFHGVLF